jgi:F420-0:gamma-glutamyl ligase-like protein
MAEISQNILLSVAKQNLLKIPGVDKKAKVVVKYTDKVLDIEYTPISYACNVYEISKRIQNVLSEKIKEKYGFNIILNVKVSLQSKNEQ